jgi:hypothetical protein
VIPVVFSVENILKGILIMASILHLGIPESRKASQSGQSYRQLISHSSPKEFGDELADKLVQDIRRLTEASESDVLTFAPGSSSSKQTVKNYFRDTRVSVLDGIEVRDTRRNSLVVIFKVSYPSFLNGSTGLVVLAESQFGKHDFQVGQGVAAKLQTDIDKEFGFSLIQAKYAEQSSYKESQGRMLKFCRNCGIGVLALSAAFPTFGFISRRIEDSARANEISLCEEAAASQEERQMEKINESKRAEDLARAHEISLCEKEAASQEARQIEETNKRNDQLRKELEREERFENLVRLSELLSSRSWSRSEVEHSLRMVRSEDYQLIESKLLEATRISDVQKTIDVLTLLVRLSRLETEKSGAETFSQDVGRGRIIAQIINNALKYTRNPEIQGLFGQALSQMMSKDGGSAYIEVLKRAKVVFED